MSADTGPTGTSPSVADGSDLFVQMPAIPAIPIVGKVWGPFVCAVCLCRMLWSRRGGVGLCLAGALTVAWALGLLLFIRVGARSQVVVSVTLPALLSHPDEEHNLVGRVYGPTLRASSYFRDPVAQHHPSFLVDGRSHPGLREKWASDPKDSRPWIELAWSGEREIRRIRMEHAGTVESSDLTSRQYTLTCLADRAPPPVVIADNEAPIAEHSLFCQGARGLRIDFVPNAPGELIRVFEVEVWGR